MTHQGISRRAVIAGLGAALLPAQALANRPPRRTNVAQMLDADGLIAASGLAGTVGFALIDPADAGGLVQGAQAGAPMMPASTLKVVTALYALSRLGAGRRFRTRVLRAGDMLVLAGGGDPVLSTDDLARLAADVVASGQTAPKRFAVWGGALPQIAEIARGQADHLAYNPALSGMILNFNRVHLGWRRANGALQMSLEARATANSPRAYTITAAPGDQRDLFSYRRDGGRESWTVARSAMARPGSRWLPVRNPELYAGDVFQTLCRAKGLALPTPEVITDLPVAEEIAAIDSPPLTTILRDMLRFSTNLTAEVVGLHASGARAPDLSAQAMQAWLVAQGQGLSFRLSDHSGLSDDTRISAQGMSRLLAGPGIAAGLPDLLRVDPLDDDLGRDPGMAGKVRAKTGTLNFVSNLAGYVDTADGRRLAFTLLCADPPRQAATSGQELPAGVLGWTKDAKMLQRRILTTWAAGA